MPSLKDPVPRQCARPGCDTEFLPKHGRAKYCSKQCLWKVKNDAAQARPDYNQKARAYRAKDPDKWKARSKADYWNNREARRLLGKKAYQETRDTSPWLHMVWDAKRRAKEKGQPFDLTPEWASARWTGRCEITNIAFERGAGLHKGPHTRAATIDKIEPKLGYVKNNCRIILQAVNALKGTLTDEDMLETAKAIVAFFDPRKD